MFAVGQEVWVVCEDWFRGQLVSHSVYSRRVIHADAITACLVNSCSLCDRVEFRPAADVYGDRASAELAARTKGAVEGGEEGRNV